ncbi:uncharacterized protein [Euwallacea fornicatus]|uniref:uncharacterized protein n=1 Tax=Euwallacea fornicatus TaxID=995702 RepID=UPI00338D6D28
MKYLASVFTLMVSLTVSLVISNPVLSKHSKSVDNKERILYDQRQEGEFNIRADLKNFVIMIIPKNSESVDTSGGGLLDLLVRAHSKHSGKHSAKKHQDGSETGGETMHFIESKTAPYHVDITKSSSHLRNDEILATQSPPVNPTALKTVEENNQQKKLKKRSAVATTAAALMRKLRSTRLSKAFVLTVPEDDFVLSNTEDDKKVVKKDGFKKKITNKNKEEWALVGALEQCGPGMVRDYEGICRLKAVDNIPEDAPVVDRDE